MAIHPALERGSVAVVTGGANGIGLAAARRLVELGLSVVIADLPGEQLDRAQHDLGEQVLTVATDVSDRSSVEQLARSAVERFGPVSVLMNNAGIGGGGDILSDPERSERILAVNLMGMMYGVQTFVPAMVSGSAPGLVINTGSKQGVTQPPGNTAYNMSKSGVKSLTEGLAHTLREQTQGRVTAHLLVPGFTFTGMTRMRVSEKPPAAWTPEQVIDTMLDGISRGQFYLWCPDNETTLEMDAKRILWNAGDIVAGRPALSRWHPDFKDAFARYMEE